MPIESLTIYACEDVDITLRLWAKLQESLDQQGLSEVFDQIEMPLLPVLAEMEYRGITVDRNMLDTYSMDLGKQLTEMAQSIYTFAGMEFNINSPKQLGEVLFDLLKISEKPKKTKTGQYQTNEEVLNELRTKHPIIPTILTYRQLTKLKSTYVDSLPEEILNARVVYILLFHKPLPLPDASLPQTRIFKTYLYEPLKVVKYEKHSFQKNPIPYWLVTTHK